MSLSLYKISEEFQTVLRELESIEGLDEQTIADTLAPYQHDLERKCLAVAAYIKNLEAEADAVKNACDAMAERKKALCNKADKMRGYLAAHLPGPLKNDQLQIKLVKPRERVVVDRPELLPENCKKVEIKPILTEIKKVMDTLPEGAAHIELGKSSISIL